MGTDTNIHCQIQIENTIKKQEQSIQIITVFIRQPGIAWLITDVKLISSLTYIWFPESNPFVFALGIFSNGISSGFDPDLHVSDLYHCTT